MFSKHSSSPYNHHLHLQQLLQISSIKFGPTCPTKTRMSLVKAVWSTGNKKSSESPLDAGLSNYNILHHDYDQISDMRDIKGYHLHE